MFFFIVKLIRNQKENVVLSLLQPNGNENTNSKSSLIQEIGASNDKAPETEEPTMMELMMAAQAEAKKASDMAKAEETKKQSKTFASGFKKGFLGGGSDTSKSKSATTSSKQIKVNSSSKSSSSNNTSASTSANEIPTIKSGTDKSLVLDDVQEAMKDDNPLIKNIKEGSKLYRYVLI